MTKLSKLAEAYSILNDIEGFDLEAKRIKAVMKLMLAQEKKDLEGDEYIDRLTDGELLAAIQTSDPKLNIQDGQMNPKTLNYIQRNRPHVFSMASKNKF